MSPAQVLEPTYRRLKRALMDGIWPGGSRLEAQRLADEFGVSMTPVRDSLNQLVGEGLVDLTPGEGFRVPSLTEQRLRDLFATNLLLLENAVSREIIPPGSGEAQDADLEYADRIASAFQTIAVRSENRVLANIVARIGERLRPVRRQEPAVLHAAQDTLEQIEASLLASPSARLSALKAYHQNCHDHVAELIARLAA